MNEDKFSIEISGIYTGTEVPNGAFDELDDAVNKSLNNSHNFQEFMSNINSIVSAAKAGFQSLGTALPKALNITSFVDSIISQLKRLKLAGGTAISEVSYGFLAEGLTKAFDNISAKMLQINNEGNILKNTFEKYQEVSYSVRDLIDNITYAPLIEEADKLRSRFVELYNTQRSIGDNPIYDKSIKQLQDIQHEVQSLISSFIDLGKEAVSVFAWEQELSKAVHSFTSFNEEIKKTKQNLDLVFASGFSIDFDDKLKQTAAGMQQFYSTAKTTGAELKLAFADDAIFNKYNKAMLEAENNTISFSTEVTNSLNNILSTMRNAADETERLTAMSEKLKMAWYQAKADWTMDNAIKGQNELIAKIAATKDAFQDAVTIIKNSSAAVKAAYESDIRTAASNFIRDINIESKAAAEAEKQLAEETKKNNDYLNNLLAGLKTNADYTEKKVKELADATKAAFKQDVNRGVDAFLRNTKREEDAAKAAAEASRKTSQDAKTAWAKSIAGLYTLISAFNSFKQAVTKAFNTVVNGSKRIVRAFTNITTSVTKAALTLSGLPAIFKGMQSAASSIKSTISSAFSGISLSSIIKESLELRSSLVEVENVIDHVFGGEGRKAIDEFTSTAVEKLGMSTLAARQFAGKFGAALTTTGQSKEAVVTMSKALTQLTSDIASFYDIEQDVAASKLFSGVISGQIKPMRELGVDMTVASLDAYTLSEGYDKLYSKMNATEKQAIRFKYAMDKLSFAHGDYLRTINSTANQLRLLKNQIKELGAIIGAIINAFFNPLVHVLNRVASAAIVAAKAIAAAMGIKLDFSSGGAGLTELNENLDDTSDSADDLAESEDNAVDSLHKLSKAAKGALSPLHKLNVLQSKNGANGDKSATSGIADIIGDIQTSASEMYPKIKDMLKGLLDWLWGLDWEGALDRLIQAINRVVKKLPGLIRELFNELKRWVVRLSDLLNQFVKGIDWTGVGNVVKEVLYGLGQTILAALKEVDFYAIGEALKDVFNSIIDDPTVFITWGAVIGTAIQDGFDFIYGVIHGLHWKSLGDDLYYFIKGIFDSIDGNAIRQIVFEALDNVGTAITEFFSKLAKDKALQKDMANDLLSVINGLADYMASPDFDAMLDSVVEGLDGTLGEIGDNLKNNNTLGKIASGIIKVIEAACRLIKGDGFQSIVTEVREALWQAFKDFWGDEEIPLPIKLGTSWLIADKTGLNDALSTLGKVVITMNLLKNAMGTGGVLGAAKKMWEGFKDFKVLFQAAEGLEKFQVVSESLYSTLTGPAGVIAAITLLIATFKGLEEAGTIEGKTLSEANANFNSFTSTIENDSHKVMTAFDNITSTKYSDKLKAMGGWFKFDGLSAQETDAAYNLTQYFETVLGMAKTDAESKAKELADAVNGNLKNLGALSSEEDKALLQGYQDFFNQANELNAEFAEKFKAHALEIAEANNNNTLEMREAIDVYYNSIKEGSDSATTLQTSNIQWVADAAIKANKEMMDDYGLTQQQIAEAAERRKEIELKGVDTVRLTQNESLDEYKEKMTEHLGYLEGAYNDYINKRKEMETNGRAEELTAEQQHQAAIAALKHEGYSQEEADRAANAARAAEFASEIENANADAAKRSTGAWKDELQNLGGSLGDILEVFTSEMVGEEGDGLIPKILGTGMDELPEKVSEKLEPVKETISTSLQELGTDTEEGGLFSGILDSASQLPEQLQPSLDETTTAITDTFGSLIETLQGEDLWGGFSGWMTENVWTPITESLDELKTKIEEVFVDGLEDIKTGWEDLATSVTDAVQTMIDGLNDAADAARSLADELANAAAAASSASSSSYNRGYPSSVQGYANGGVFRPNTPQLAILGDNKSQTEYALTTGHLREIASMMASAIDTSGVSGVEQITVPIYLGTELIDQEIINVGNMHNYRSNGR